MEERIKVWLVRLMREADLTLAEICERLEDHAIRISPGALWHQIDKWGLTLKKSADRRRARVDIRSARQETITSVSVSTP